MDRDRLDRLLVKRGLFANRSRARGAIMAGEIYVDGCKVDKAGTYILEDASIEHKGKTYPYVSRGGLKLERALKAFSIDPHGLQVLDIGASTGGFTHSLLQHGAAGVYAVDVGYNQIDYSLRTHERVVVMERVNARHLTPDDLPFLFPLITVDVSFISLRLILPPLKALLEPDGRIIALVKPQFEVGRERVKKRGRVRDPEVHREMLYQLALFCERLGLYPKALIYSPLLGKKEQNIEYFLFLGSSGEMKDLSREIVKVVEEAHSRLSS